MVELKKKALLRQLFNYKAFNAEEEKQRQRILKLFNTNASPFDRDHSPKHLAVSAFVVNPSFTHVLLVKHKKLDMWLQPGGHCEDEKTMREGALREITEETGLVDILLSNEVFDVNVYEYPCGEHVDYDIQYLAIANMNEPLVLQEDEVSDIRWVPVDELLDYNPKEPFIRAIEKLKRLQKGKTKLSLSKCVAK